MISIIIFKIISFIDTGIQFSRIEQAKRDVQLSTIYKICNYFEISLKDFFDEDFKI